MRGKSVILTRGDPDSQMVVTTNVRKSAEVVVPVGIGEGPNQMNAKVQRTEI